MPVLPKDIKYAQNSEFLNNMTYFYTNNETRSKIYNCFHTILLRHIDVRFASPRL